MQNIGVLGARNLLHTIQKDHQDQHLEETLSSIEMSGLWINNRQSHGIMFGLVALRFQARCAEDLTLSLVEVRVGQLSETLDGSSVFIKQEGSTWQGTVHVNTHLIQNGNHSVEITLTQPGANDAEARSIPILVENSGALAEAVAQDLRAFGTPAVFGRVVDCQMFPYAEGRAPTLPRDGRHHELPMSLEPAESYEAAHRHLERWGFCVLPDQLPRALVDAFVAETDEAIVDGRLPWQKGSSVRIHGAHRLPAGRQIWLFPPVLKFLAEHFGDEPSACQTLTYINGSEQDAHQDTIHLTPYPVGYMCGVWIALQDVVPDSGELVVYPESHRSQRLLTKDLGLAKVSNDYSSYVVFSKRIQELIDENGYQAVVFRPKAGQILVWSENLIHAGGQRINRDLARKSIVSHYFARGSVAYYDSRGEAAVQETL